MDQKNLVLAIALSIGILLGFQLLFPQPQPQRPTTAQAPAAGAPAQPGPAQTAPGGPGIPAAPAVPGVTVSSAPAPEPESARITIEGTRGVGTINTRGARLDDLRLRDYRETVEANSPLVRLLAARGGPQGYFIEFGWVGSGTERVPDGSTVWTTSGTSVAPGRPVRLEWDNGAGLVFSIEITPDPDYLFRVSQTVRNTGAAPASLRPYARIRRDYTPQTAGFFILHEGFISVADGRLHEETYDSIKSEAARRRGPGWEQTATLGWAGFVDKYWLTAVVPDQQTPVRLRYLHINEGGDRWQVDMAPVDAVVVPPGGTSASAVRVFAGAKEVHLLDRYRDGSPTSGGPIQDFDKAIDFGWFYFLTKPFFYALDWLYRLLGNFGLAIMAFTVIVKLAFFPLANKSYKAMSKMKLLAPKMQELKERYGKDPQAMQREMMTLYRTEKVNPASGCLPILIQIPVFFALYKVIFVTIEMRHAPFIGWIRDLSAPDPTNVFNLFGLLPWDLTGVPFLHLGLWPIFMGFTMWLQMRLNPQPPDPIQQKIFAFMPFIFTFMLATFPAGLVIYWSWNNLLSVAQQWVIMRQTRLEPKRLASAKT